MNDLLNKLIPPSKDAGFKMDGYWVWGSSVIKGEDGKYHMLVSRWPKYTPFHPGWITDSEIVRAVADTPEGPFEFQEVVLGKRGAEYWDGCMAHNPRINKIGDKYVLIYTGSTYPFKPVEPGENPDNFDPRTIVGRSNKRVGMAIADSIEGPWTRFDKPILPTKPGTYYSFLNSNPTPVVNPDGSIYVMFKSRKYDDYRHSHMYIGIARAASWDSEFEVVTEKPVFGHGEAIEEIEDPFVWRKSDGSWRMIAKDMTGDICGTQCDGIMAESKNGINWQVSDPAKAYSRTIKWSDGETQDFALLERPYILFEDGQPVCFYAAVSDGNPYNREATNTWNLAIRIRS